MILVLRSPIASITLALPCTRQYSFAASPPFTDGEPFLAIKPVDPVDPRRLALPPQQDEQPAVVETPLLVGQIAQPAAQSHVWRAAGAITDPLPIRSYDRAGSPFRQARDGLQMRPQRARRRPYHFIERSSRRAPRRASARPEASSASRCLPPRPSTASPRKRPCRQI